MFKCCWPTFWSVDWTECLSGCLPAEQLRRHMNCLWTVVTLEISSHCTVTFSGSPTASIELAVERFRHALAFSIDPDTFVPLILCTRTIHAAKMSRAPSKHNSVQQTKIAPQLMRLQSVYFYLDVICACIGRQTMQNECHTFFLTKYKWKTKTKKREKNGNKPKTQSTPTVEKSWRNEQKTHFFHFTASGFGIIREMAQSN